MNEGSSREFEEIFSVLLQIEFRAFKAFLKIFSNKKELS